LPTSAHKNASLEDQEHLFHYPDYSKAIAVLENALAEQIFRYNNLGFFRQLEFVNYQMVLYRRR